METKQRSPHKYTHTHTRVRSCRLEAPASAHRQGQRGAQALNTVHWRELLNEDQVGLRKAIKKEGKRTIGGSAESDKTNEKMAFKIKL